MIRSEIESHILAVLDGRKVTLPDQEVLFLRETLTTFVLEAVDKYIQGHIEHTECQGSFLDVDGTKELSPELIDAVIYNGLNRWKNRP